MEIAVLDAEPVIPIAVRVVATDVVQPAVDFVGVVVPVDAVVVPGNWYCRQSLKR